MSPDDYKPRNRMSNTVFTLRLVSTVVITYFGITWVNPLVILLASALWVILILDVRNEPDA